MNLKNIKFFKYIPSVLFFVLLILFIEVWGITGVWTFIAFVLLLGLGAIVKNWDGYMGGIRMVEMKIWGRSLDKEYWEKGEKLPKLKFVFKKDKGGIKK